MEVCLSLHRLSSCLLITSPCLRRTPTIGSTMASRNCSAFKIRENRVSVYLLFEPASLAHLHRHSTPLTHRPTNAVLDTARSSYQMPIVRGCTRILCCRMHVPSAEPAVAIKPSLPSGPMHPTTLARRFARRLSTLFTRSRQRFPSDRPQGRLSGTGAACWGESFPSTRKFLDTGEAIFACAQFLDPSRGSIDSRVVNNDSTPHVPFYSYAAHQSLLLVCICSRWVSQVWGGGGRAGSASAAHTPSGGHGHASEANGAAAHEEQGSGKRKRDRGESEAEDSGKKKSSVDIRARLFVGREILPVSGKKLEAGSRRSSAESKAQKAQRKAARREQGHSSKAKKNKRKS